MTNWDRLLEALIVGSMIGCLITGVAGYFIPNDIDSLSFVAVFSFLSGVFYHIAILGDL